MRLLLLTLLLTACDGQVPGSGPTCVGPSADCYTLLYRLPLIRDGFIDQPDVTPLIDYVVVKGGPFEFHDHSACATNEKAITAKGVRCIQRIALDCPPLTAQYIQAHEYLHCALAFSTGTGDGIHSTCPEWGERYCGVVGLVDEVANAVP